LKLKKTLKTLSSGQIYKKTKKKQKTQKNKNTPKKPLGWCLKTRVFSNLELIGRADSAHSNYTQLGQGGRARTLSGPAHHRGMSGGPPGDRSSFPPGGRPSPAASPHLVTPEEEEGATAADSEPAAEDQHQQQLGLSEWNAFPGYSVVTTGGEPAPGPPPERRINGYVPALPLMPPTSMGGSQVRLKRLSHGIDKKKN
jgi:hypothetical protein